MRKIEITERNGHYWHLRLWDWLSKNPKRGKKDWPGWKYIDENKIPAHCFACFIAAKRHGTTHFYVQRCAECPLKKWKQPISFSFCMLYEFGEWNKSHGKKKMKLAEFIRDMEWVYPEGTWTGIPEKKE